MSYAQHLHFKPHPGQKVCVNISPAVCSCLKLDSLLVVQHCRVDDIPSMLDEVREASVVLDRRLRGVSAYLLPVGMSMGSFGRVLVVSAAPLTVCSFYWPFVSLIKCIHTCSPPSYVNSLLFLCRTFHAISIPAYNVYFINHKPGRMRILACVCVCVCA